MPSKVSSKSVTIPRHFTEEDTIDPFTYFNWEKRDSVLTDYRTGETVFRQDGVEVPEFWSQNATNILAQKYFRGRLGETNRESSLRQIVHRIANTITIWGIDGGYFDKEAAAHFYDELVYILVSQRAAFNSPVWFNIGWEGRVQQAAACYLLDVEDNMDSIMRWYQDEAKIFQGGSGSGINISKLRGSMEPLSQGGTSSGPVSFMRGADSSAGAIKSGGNTRRSAKMVILDADHPDIREFIWCKSREEKKGRALSAAGFKMDLGEEDAYSLQYQNANNSVRVTDEFMRAVENDDNWFLSWRTDPTSGEWVRARDIWNEMAQAAWECADPGVQFHTTINKWHTVPKSGGEIITSNPCSEHMFVTWTACNLASINLMKYLGEDNSWQRTDFLHTVKIMITAQEILVGASEYPNKKIAKATKEYRPLGLGYANLGATLMAQGMPYDSDSGRRFAAEVTSDMAAQAYLTSALIAKVVGPYDHWTVDCEDFLNVIDMHRAAADRMGLEESLWRSAYEAIDAWGPRNAQVCVEAPTGTISFLMDCDTTGIEPDFSLLKSKKLADGGTMTIVNQSVERALGSLNYSPLEQAGLLMHLEQAGTFEGSSLKHEHLPVFATAVGEGAISPMGHIKMMGATQPFFSGAISKTINMPEDATVEDIQNVYFEGWKLGLKSLAVYRDNCKVAQPLSTLKHPTITETASTPVRVRPTKSRRALNHSFTIGGCKGYMTVGEYDDGTPCEIFLRVAKQGSTLNGLLDAFAISISMGLQYGVPLTAFIDKYTYSQFEPNGMTDDPDLRMATSILDYVFKKMALVYLPNNIREGMGILSVGERIEALESPEHTVTISLTDEHISLCPSCGGIQQRAGTCMVCTSCGSTTGCS